MKGLSRSEIRKCDKCNNAIGMTPYRFSLEQHLIDPEAVRSEAGLEMMIRGSASLASVFSPNREFTIPISEFRGIICQDCAMGSGLFDVGCVPTEIGGLPK